MEALAGFDYRRYRRVFRAPARTPRGVWRAREGFVVRLASASGGVGFGEVAPIEAFGSEGLEAAERALRAFGRAGADAEKALAGAPAAAFGVGSARAMAAAGLPPSERDFAVAAFLPPNDDAPDICRARAEDGFSVFKLKIGASDFAPDIERVRRVAAALPPRGRLRLDANASLGAAGLERWMRALAAERESIEFLEQPLPPGEETAMRAVMEAWGIPIALDETLCRDGGTRWLGSGAWPGPLVVKPALAGDPAAWPAVESKVADRIALSSVFETSVGVANALQAARRLGAGARAIGFGTTDAFADGLSPVQAGPTLSGRAFDAATLRRVWDALPHSTPTR